MTPENESIELGDGRKVSYAIYGTLNPASCTTIIYMHGFPSSRFEGRLWHSACVARGVRLIAPDRPGSGRSTFQHNRRILDWPADVVALADLLNINNFYILGVSGGSPYALACLKNISKERILGAAVLSGVYPFKLGTEGMMMMNRMLFGVAPWMTGLTTFMFESIMGRAARNKDPKVLEDLMSRDMGNHPGDHEAIHDPTIWPTYVAMTREFFYHNGKGAGWEAKLYGSDWGFELEQLEIRIPLTLWHGTGDANCPVAMARKAKDLLGCDLKLQEGDGHMNYVFRERISILGSLLGITEPETDGSR